MNYEFKKLHSALDTSGASLLFVLAVTLLLIAISVSVLVAAGAGMGAMARQAEHNQMRLLDESVHESIMHSLKNTDNANSLGVQIITALYNIYYANNDEEASDDIGEIVFRLAETDNGFTVVPNVGQPIIDDNVRITNITLTILEPEANDERVVINRARPAVFSPVWNDEVNAVIWDFRADREPKTVIVNFTLLVSVEIEAGDRRMVSEAEYEFDGDDFGFPEAPDPLHPTCEPANNAVEPPCLNNCIGVFGEMGPFTGGGEWTLERRGVMIHREDD